MVLNVLHIIARYHRIRSNPNQDVAPRTFIFGGKSAPGYFMAKLIIKLINAVGSVINNDPLVRDKMKVVFVPNFNVRTGQSLYAAAELSEQVSTAGKEASGTGNMKFMMNGALTIGTLDGANVEIREEAGAENFFLFGMTAEEVVRLKGSDYGPEDSLLASPELAGAMRLIETGHFSRGNTEVFRALVENLARYDPYFVLADYASYVACQEQVSAAWRDTLRA